MKLHVRKDTEVRIVRKDTILFSPGKRRRRVEVAQAAIGNFDSTPYERLYQEWDYSAELHRHEGKLWVCITEYERRTTIEESDWVHRTKEEPSLYVSEDQGATWTRDPAPSNPHLNDATRLDRIDSD